MQDALLLIIERSPIAAKDAMATLRAIDTDSPMAQQRYNHTVEQAFGDAMAVFNDSERKLIASYVESTNFAVRNLDVRVRVTAEEKDAIQQMAGEAGQNVSDFIRRKIGMM